MVKVLSLETNFFAAIIASTLVSPRIFITSLNKPFFFSSSSFYDYYYIPQNSMWNQKVQTLNFSKWFQTMNSFVFSSPWWHHIPPFLVLTQHAKIQVFQSMIPQQCSKTQTSTITTNQNQYLCSSKFSVITTTNN